MFWLHETRRVQSNHEHVEVEIDCQWRREAVSGKEGRVHTQPELFALVWERPQSAGHAGQSVGRLGSLIPLHWRAEVGREEYERRHACETGQPGVSRPQRFVRARVFTYHDDLCADNLQYMRCYRCSDLWLLVWIW